MTWKEGSCIHVVLDEGITDHNIPHRHTLCQTSRDAGNQDSGDIGMKCQQGCRQCGVHFSASAKGHGHVMALQSSVMNFPASNSLRTFLMKIAQKVPEFRIHGGDDSRTIFHEILVIFKS